MSPRPAGDERDFNVMRVREALVAESRAIFRILCSSALEEHWESALRCLRRSCAVVAILFFHGRLESILLIRFTDAAVYSPLAIFRAWSWRRATRRRLGWKSRRPNWSRSTNCRWPSLRSSRRQRSMRWASLRGGRVRGRRRSRVTAESEVFEIGVERLRQLGDIGDDLRPSTTRRWRRSTTTLRSMSRRSTTNSTIQAPPADW